jgi:hypothetical protein
MKSEIILQLKAILLAAVIWFPILFSAVAIIKAPSWVCVDFNGWPICYPEPGDE